MSTAKPATIKKQTSSGGVIFRNSRKGIEVALIAVKNKTVWCLPKGAIDKNEDFQTAAVREVREETGLLGEIIDEIEKISYWYFSKDENVRFNKTVYFYLMEYKSGSTDAHDQEVDEAQWFLIDEAINRLTYKGEKEILQKARQMIETKFKM